jgi:predicted ATPase
LLSNIWFIPARSLAVFAQGAKLITKDLAQKIGTLNQQVQSGNASKLFLQSIQTVKFRNFKPDGQIEFRSPVTAIVGKNGTGKSTVLFLAGSAFAPPATAAQKRTKGKTFNDFVPDSQKDKMPIGSIYGFIYGDKTDHRYIWHERKSGDPSRAGKREWDRRGVKTDRKQRAMVFLGFDKTISNSLLLAPHFGLTEQDIEGRLNSVGRQLVKIGQTTVDTINFITGKKYGIIEKRTDQYSQLSEHCHGYVVDGQYSDIACGSGEIAIIRIVESILSAQGNSLILIDEPENGVHQIAQERLVEFIIEQSIARGHQFIFTTHSETIIEQLGPDSIILLEPGAGEKIIYPKNVNRAVAFKAISDKCEPKYTAIVEDPFAESFLNSILQSDPTTRDLFRIKSSDSDGWTEMIKKDFPKAFATYSHSHNAAKPVLVLDGDARTSINLSDLQSEFGTRAKLNKYLADHRMAGLIRRVGRLSGAGGNGISFRMYFKPHLKKKNDDNLLKMIEDYLEYFPQHLVFLPGTEPPEVVLCAWVQAHLANPKSPIGAVFLSVVHLDRREQFKDEFSQTLPSAYGERRNYSKKLIDRLDEYSSVLRDLILTQWTIDPNNRTTVKSMLDQLAGIAK